MIKKSGLVAGLVLAVLLNETALAAQFSPGFDKSDLVAASTGLGKITPEAFQVINVALPEMMKYGVRLEKYGRISVHVTDRYYYVVFDPNELNSPIFGRMPGTQLGIEVQIRKADMRVVGSRSE